MKEIVISYIKEILEEQDKELKLEIKEDSNLRDLGLSSFDLASLTVKIEDEYDDDFYHAYGVEEYWQEVRQEISLL